MAAKVKHVDGREGEVLESDSTKSKSLVLFHTVGAGQTHRAVFGDPVKKKNFVVEHKADATHHFLSEWVSNDHLSAIPG